MSRITAFFIKIFLIMLLNLLPTFTKAEADNIFVLKELIRQQGLKCNNIPINTNDTESYPNPCDIWPGGQGGFGKKTETHTFDSTVINAALCYSGEDWACQNIFDSMDSQGGLWRSPLHKQIGNSMPQEGQGRYSWDNAIGLLLALVKKYNDGQKDQVQSIARAWVAWMENHTSGTPITVGLSSKYRFALCDYGVSTFGYADYCALEEDAMAGLPLADLPHRAAMINEVLKYIGVNPPQTRIKNPITGSIIASRKLGEKVGSDIKSYMWWKNNQCSGGAIFQGDFQCNIVALSSLILREIGSLPSSVTDINDPNYGWMVNTIGGYADKNPFMLWVRNGKKLNQQIVDITMEGCRLTLEKLSQGNRNQNFHLQRPPFIDKIKNEGPDAWGCIAMLNLLQKSDNYSEFKFSPSIILPIPNNISDPKCISFQEPSSPDNLVWADNSLCSNASDVVLQWSVAGPIPGMRCANVQEPGDPNNEAWVDNYICSSRDIGLQWSFTGPITGKHCINIHEPGSLYNTAWLDNYLCSNEPILEYYLGPNCISVHEPGSPTDSVWKDNLLCTVRNQELVWSVAGPIPGMHCANVQEPGDPNNWAWVDNYICSPRDIGLQWSVGGPVPGKYCVNVQEPKDPNNPAWFDNYLCSSESVGFSWRVQ